MKKHVRFYVKMEKVSLENFNKSKTTTTPMENVHFYLSYESDQDDSTTATHLQMLLRFILTKRFIDLILTNMWDRMYSCTNNYCRISSIYIVSCPYLSFLNNY